MLINQSAVIKLCDFGISRDFTENTPAGGIIGTDKYIPPSRQRTIQDDMWALGISLLEIVSGKHPFADFDPREKYVKIFTWKPSVPITISDDMQELILHL